MGERGNIHAVHPEYGHDIWLYTHWYGPEVPQRVHKALALRERWNDPGYLTRILFDHLTDGDRGTTGFGISNGKVDGSYPTVTVDIENQTVTFGDTNEEGQDPFRWSFEEYIHLDDDKLNGAYAKA